MEKYEYSVVFVQAIPQESVAGVMENLYRFFQAQKVGTADNKAFRIVCPLNPAKALVALNAFCKGEAAAVLTYGMKLGV